MTRGPEIRSVYPSPLTKTLPALMGVRCGAAPGRQLPCRRHRSARGARLWLLDRLWFRFTLRSLGVDEMARPKSSPPYPNAPLEFVAFEVRYPLAPALVQDAMLPQLQKAFYGWLPLVETVATAAAEIQAFMSAASLPMQAPTGMGVRFLSRDRHLSVSVSRDKLVVETTTYRGYSEFRQFIERALTALEKLDAAIPGISRIGLRYIDEVRVGRKVVKPGDWRPYVSPKLIGPLFVAGDSAEPDLYQGLLQFDFGDGRRAVVRFGAMKGQAVGNAPLRRRSTSAGGPYFLLDTDSFWSAGDAVPEYSVQRVLELCDALHGPVRGLFEAAITDRLRREVLRGTKRGN